MNSEPLPKWIMKRYATSWNTFKDKEITLEELTEALKEDKRVILLFISHLRKHGWIDIEFDKIDARKRIYKLRNPEKVVEAMIK